MRSVRGRVRTVLIVITLLVAMVVALVGLYIGFATGFVHEQIAIAVGTVVLALFTAFLAAATGALAWETRGLAGVSKDELVLLREQTSAIKEHTRIATEELAEMRAQSKAAADAIRQTEIYRAALQLRGILTRLRSAAWSLATDLEEAKPNSKTATEAVAAWEKSFHPELEALFFHLDLVDVDDESERQLRDGLVAMMKTRSDIESLGLQINYLTYDLDEAISAVDVKLGLKSSVERSPLRT
jgi:hypothetical protein